MTGTVSVVAGGWSVREWDLYAIPGYVIAINDSALHLPMLSAIVTMDRLWTENRWDWLCEHKFPTWVRTAALKNVPYQDHEWLHPFECNHESYTFSKEEGRLNGTNSAMCGFNLAYQKCLGEDREICLFGFDMCHGPNGEQHWFPDYPWNPKGGSSSGKLKEWAPQFHVAASMCRKNDITVYNMSSRSLIKDFPKAKGMVLQ